MIKAVLMDLDDTLITTNTEVFFSAYLKAMGEYASINPPANSFGENIVAAYDEALEAYDATRQLYPRFLEHLVARLRYSKNEEELDRLFAGFFTQVYQDLKPMIQPRKESPPFLRWLLEHNYRVVVATNPAIPESATLHRMAWGGISPDDYPFAAITTLENMHFGKPQPEFFEEILLRLGINADEAIMVGDDWSNDIVGAAACGMNTFWITEGEALPPDNTPISGYGTYQQLIAQVESGWLDNLLPPPVTYKTLIHRLRAFPAQLNTLQVKYSDDILEARPAGGKCSASDIVRHLVNYESIEIRERLRQVIERDNPIFSTDGSLCDHARECSPISMTEAFSEFVRQRAETIKWLFELPEEAWKKPAYCAISGPTKFEEMVRFMTEHDRTQLCQIQDAIGTNNIIPSSSLA